jgi:hypothetical protein
VPENLSSVLESSPRVDGMYDAGAPFSLDVLIGARDASEGVVHVMPCCNESARERE